MKDMKKVKDLTGQRFGRLVVIGIDPDSVRKTYWYCRCDCGNTKKVRSDSLQSGRIRSCGCLKKEQDKENLINDSIRKSSAYGEKVGTTRLYHIWSAMKGRCKNPHDARYHRYGGRGISVCEEWSEDFGSFRKWALENGYDDSLTIDRIDNDGCYEPSNCRWVTQKQQSNNRSTNIKITIGNSTRTLKEWCTIFDVDASVVYQRYKRNGFTGIDDLFNK